MIQNNEQLSNNNCLGTVKLPVSLNTVEYKNIYKEDYSDLNRNVSDYVVLSVVIKGKGIYKVLNESSECQTGDMYIINGAVSHCYYAIDDNTFPTVLSLSFEPRSIFSKKIADSTSSQFCYGIFRDKIPISYAMLNSGSLKEIINLFNFLKNELESGNYASYEAARAYLTLLLITVARYINLADTALPNHSKEWSVVSAAIREIYLRCSEVDMTLESIASSLFVSKSHLSRMFQKVVGESFLDYVRKIRINKACNLLHNTSLTNEEIVGKCGLKDIPTFYRQFKAVNGMTPHQYRLSRNSVKASNSVDKEKMLAEISEAIQNGRFSIIKTLVENAIDSGINSVEILNNGLLHGMNSVAKQFQSNEVFVPTVLAASKSMNNGMETLKPYLVNEELNYKGKVCIGTVRGDLHDIGKNLVKIMLESKGLEVIDLGVDVAPQEFIETAIKQKCNVICCSALLTTTMGVMKDIVDLAKHEGIRKNVKILIGGAPITESFCKQIGADLYTADASSAADAALNFCIERKEI